MFIGSKEYTFQEKHVNSLLHKCADHEEIVLSAPTGSGKTIIASWFIDEYQKVTQYSFIQAVLQKQQM